MANNSYQELKTRSDVEQFTGIKPVSDMNEQREDLAKNLSQGNDKDLDAVLDKVVKLEDLNQLDSMLSKLYFDYQYNEESLNSLVEKSGETKLALKSSKYSISELQRLHSQEQSTEYDLRCMIEEKRMQLEKLLLQQVEDLEQFENDMTLLSQHFINGPKMYESNSLLQKVLELKKDLEESTIEFTQYKEDLQVTEGKLKQGQKIDKDLQNIPTKIFEESVEDINSLNEKLTNSVEHITNRVNSLRLGMKSFSLI